MSVDPLSMRNAMRFWATGVAIVTSKKGEEEQHGMTVNSFTSLSLEPPLVLVSLEEGTRTHRYVLHSKVFGVTILAENQRAISTRFASELTESSYRFEGLRTHTLQTGVVFISEGLSFFDCKVVASYPAGTHTVFVGEVLAVDVEHDRQPLLYFNRDYRKIG